VRPRAAHLLPDGKVAANQQRLSRSVGAADLH
jgi:hypothetical protein